MNVRHGVAALRERGVRFLIDYFLQSVWFDLRHRTSTSSRVPKERQSIDATAPETDNGLLYVASFTSVVRDAVKVARRTLGPSCFDRAQFLDLGCGKGKAVLVYAQEFGKSTRHAAVGIEYDPSLAQSASRNIRRCGLRSDEARVVADSAVHLAEHIQGDLLIVYLYNSFQGETLVSVLDELSARPHVLIYVDPAERSRLDGYGYTIHHDHAGKYHADTWLVASAGLPASVSRVEAD